MLKNCLAASETHYSRRADDFILRLMLRRSSLSSECLIFVAVKEGTIMIRQSALLGDPACDQDLRILLSEVAGRQRTVSKPSKS